VRYILTTKHGFCYWDSDDKKGRYIDKDASAFDLDETLHAELILQILKKGIVAKSYSKNVLNRRKLCLEKAKKETKMPIDILCL